MKKYRVGLLIGRFQPFHKGHLYLFHHVIKRVEKLIIGIGSANVYDEDNPFTYEERKKMIEEVIKQEKLNSCIEKIVPLDDFYDDELWFKNTLEKSGKIDIAIGNNEWPNHIFETRGYPVWRVGFFKKYLYEGQKIRTLIRQKKKWFDRVPSYLVSSIEDLFAKQRAIPYRFQHIAVGGTFDHFHKGHEALINTALKYGNTLSIGITTQAMHKDKTFLSAVESFDQRKKSVMEYLKKKKTLGRAGFFPLSDIYGSTRNDGTIEALVVSKSTYPNAVRINRLRTERKLPELKIMCIKDVKGTDGQLISSERIRKGEIDREGNNFQFSSASWRINFQKKQLILPEYLRKELRKPLGKVIKGKENELKKTARHTIQFINELKPAMVIAVGDIIATSLERIGFIPDLKIIDYRSRRKEISNFQFPISNKIPNTKFQIYKKVVNKPGTISREAISAIKRSIELFLKTHKKQTIAINGEEDLLALPAILSAPLKTVVLYGQMDLGVVFVEVDEKIKDKIRKIIKKFRSKP